MRKLFLISAFVLASASAQASDIGSLIPAGNDTPAAASTAAPAEATPAASRKRASSSSNKSQASRRETDEQNARHIAAQYGISW
jgi:ribosomal protein L12E/L44/L45/RPP1/RPP2